MKEIWKDIKDYEGLYQVSNLGRVKSLSRLVNSRYGKRLKKEIILIKSNFIGYEQVSLCENNLVKNYLVHRLVATAFAKKYKCVLEVNHIDGVRNNNAISNLEWVTHSENIKHSFTHLGRKPICHWKGKKGYEHLSSKEVAAYHPNGELYKVFGSTMEAGRSGFTFSSVAACARGVRMSHKNLIWKYI